MSHASPDLSAPATLYLVACKCPAERDGDFGATLLTDRREALEAIERDGHTCDDCRERMRVVEYARRMGE